MAKSATPKRRTAAPKPYHHGDLRRVLIDAALKLAEEGGPEAVSVREAARRAGVSPGAPFRHFPSRDALMMAVAEEAQRRFRLELEAALAPVPADDPLARFRALGLGYLRWAMQNPEHFEVISNGRLFDHDGAATGVGSRGRAARAGRKRHHAADGRGGRQGGVVLCLRGSRRRSLAAARPRGDRRRRHRCAGRIAAHDNHAVAGLSRSC